MTFCDQRSTQDLKGGGVTSEAASPKSYEAQNSPVQLGLTLILNLSKYNTTLQQSKISLTIQN